MQKITDAAIDNISVITSLEELDFSECDRITDAALAKLAKFENLKRLNVNGCTQLTDKGIQQLAAKKNWEFIGVSGCKQVTDAGVKKCRRHCREFQCKKMKSFGKRINGSNIVTKVPRGRGPWA